MRRENADAVLISGFTDSTMSSAKIPLLSASIKLLYVVFNISCKAGINNFSNDEDPYVESTPEKVIEYLQKEND